MAASDAFEARARVAHDSRGRTWVAWEEGARGWGHPYRGNALLWNNSTDASGPLHRLRRVHLATLDERGRVRHLAKPLPMPSFDRARRMPNRREGGEGVGGGEGEGVGAQRAALGAQLVRRAARREAEQPPLLAERGAGTLGTGAGGPE